MSIGKIKVPLYILLRENIIDPVKFLYIGRINGGTAINLVYPGKLGGRIRVVYPFGKSEHCIIPFNALL